jgi:hypothetical protein
VTSGSSDYTIRELYSVNTFCIRIRILEPHIVGESTLHPMYFPPKKKYKKVLILYFFGKNNLGFDF